MVQSQPSRGEQAVSPVPTALTERFGKVAMPAAFVIWAQGSAQSSRARIQRQGDREIRDYSRGIVQCSDLDSGAVIGWLTRVLVGWVTKDKFATLRWRTQWCRVPLVTN